MNIDQGIVRDGLPVSVTSSVAITGSLPSGSNNIGNVGSVPYAVKITISGNITYVGKAAVGTAQGTAAWQCQKIDESSGTVITWADGNSNFDNVATDLTALTYS